MHISNHKNLNISTPFNRFKLFAESKITIINKEEIIVEGCIGVNGYYSDAISLKIPSGKFTVHGSGLSITAFDENAFVLKGKIDSMEF